MEILNNNDVISVVDIGEAEFNYGNTLKVQQLLEEYKEYENIDVIESNLRIFDDYIECEVLRQDANSKGWRRGKIKFVVQFEPDETNSHANSNSLDDIRERIDISK